RTFPPLLFPSATRNCASTALSLLTQLERAFMSTKVKVLLGVLAGATFMFVVFVVILLGAMFSRHRAAQASGSKPVSPVTSAKPLLQRAVGESITPSHFEQGTRLNIRSQPELEFGREPFTFTFWFRTAITNRPLAFM